MGWWDDNVSGGNWLGPILNYIGQSQSTSSAEHQQRQSDQLTREQMEMQKEFAQQGVRWRVEDAKQAGISPLVAFGGSTHTPTPVTRNTIRQPKNPLSAMGQSITRAQATQTTQAERELIIARTNRENAGTEYQQALTSKLRRELNGDPSMPGGSARDSSGMPISGDSRTGDLSVPDTITRPTQVPTSDAHGKISGNISMENNALFRGKSLNIVSQDFEELDDRDKIASVQVQGLKAYDLARGIEMGKNASQKSLKELSKWKYYVKRYLLPHSPPGPNREWRYSLKGYAVNMPKEGKTFMTPALNRSTNLKPKKFHRRIPHNIFMKQ